MASSVLQHQHHDIAEEFFDVDFSVVDLELLLSSSTDTASTTTTAMAAPAGTASLDDWTIPQDLLDELCDMSDGEHTSSSSCAGAQTTSGKAMPRARAKYTHSLSADDIALLRSEGYEVPDVMSKAEEARFRQLRRKIKNKRLAHDTRQKNKDYVSTLEGQTSQLQTRVATLEAENRSLLQQLLDLRKSLGHPSSLLVIAMAFSLVVVSGAPVPSASAPPAPPCDNPVTCLVAALGPVIIPGSAIGHAVQAGHLDLPQAHRLGARASRTL